MTYINTNTGAYPISADDIKQEHQGTSFPGDVAGFEIAIGRMGYAIVASTDQPVIDYTQNITEGNPVETSSGYEQSWVVSPATADEINQRTTDKAKEQRLERNQRLEACDWTQLGDSPLNADDKMVWALYRETLRMVPEQPGFPWNVQWPPEPSTSNTAASGDPN